MRIVQLFILSHFFLFLACKNTPNAANQTHIASPFDTTVTSSQSLTDQDRAQLAAATGKKATITDEKTVFETIEKAAGKLHLFCFWSLGNAESVATVKALKSLSDKPDFSTVKCVFINLSADKPDAINLFIREQQLTDEVLHLPQNDLSFFKKILLNKEKLPTTLPVILMVNKSEQIFQYYHKPLDMNELQAIVQPLM